MIRNKNIAIKFFLYCFFMIYSITVFYPIFLMIISALKSNKEIFTAPYKIPEYFRIENFVELFQYANYGTYFKNSIIVAIISILLVLVCSSLASFVLAKHSFFANKFFYIYLICGVMLPLKLGTITILQMMTKLKLFDTIYSLIIVYAAYGIPYGILILTDFIKMIPEDLLHAARIDGCGELKIFRMIVLPFIRPALATVAIFIFLPIWNDFWFPLVLTKSESSKTIPLATALLYGQYETNFGKVFAVLSLASIPVIILYLILSRQFIKNMYSGAFKG